MAIGLLVLGGLSLLVARNVGVAPGDVAGARAPAEKFTATPVSVRGTYLIDAQAVVHQNGDELVDLELMGKLEISQQGDAVDVIERWQFAGTIRSSSTDLEPTTALAESLQTAFFVERSADGTVTGFRFGPRTQRLAQTTWRSLALETQLLLQPLETWEVQEEDASGRYQARYTRRPSELLKEQLVYVRGHNPDILPSVLSSHSTFKLDDGLANAEASTELAYESGLMGRLVSRVDVQLIRQSLDSSAPATAQNEYAEAQALSLTDSGTAVSLRNEMDRVKARGFTWQSALAGLHEKDGEHRARAGAGLISIMRLQPETARNVGQHVKTGGPLAEELIQMLAEASTEASLTEVTSIADSPAIGAPMRLRAVQALSFAPNPTKVATDWLQKSLDHKLLGESARLALGSSARSLQKTDPARADALSRDLVNRSATASGPELKQYVAALGNSGSAIGLERIRELLHDPDEAVRAQAALSLRHIEGASADVLLAEQLSQGTRAVRTAALRAAHYREARSPLVEALISVLTSDPLAEVRSAAVGTALGWMSGSPAIVEALTRVAANDPDAAIRDAVRLGLVLTRAVGHL